MKPARRLQQSNCSAIRNQNGCSILFGYVLPSFTKSLTHLGRNRITAVDWRKGRGPRKVSIRYGQSFIEEEGRESVKILIERPKGYMLQNKMEKSTGGEV